MLARSLCPVLILAFLIQKAEFVAADDPPAIDPAKLESKTRAILEGHGAKVQAGLWVGGGSGKPAYSSDIDTVLPTASAIKTAILVELFARFAEALDASPAGLDAILKDDHPAIAHFKPAQREEIRKGLGGATVRRIGGVMMGSVAASNIVYNAAANLSIALLGGPSEATRLIHQRDPSFATIAVRRYMLTDRKVNGDNTATTASLAAVLQALATKRVPGVETATVDAIRRAIIARDDPKLGRVFVKDGDLATDPITCVRSGWVEKGGQATVFVVMLAQDGPGGKARDAAYTQLSATSARLTEALLDVSKDAPR